MNLTLSLHSPLQSVFGNYANTRIREIFLVFAGVILLSISAHIIIPLKPVPLTFQSSAVIFVGMVYGLRLAMGTLIAYLLAGLCGLPVFAPIDNHVFFGPTVGYLLGFLPASALCGYLAEKGFARTIIGSFIAACFGTCIIFLFGITALSFLIGWQNAIMTGLLPFIFTEPMKLMTFSIVIPKFWKNK